MNSIERVMAAVSFQKADRIPVVAQVFGHAAVQNRVRLVEYLKSGEIIARCQLEALDYYSYDAVFALMDTSVETEAVGSVLTYPDHNYPHVKTYAADTISINNLCVPDPLRAGRMPELLKAATILRTELNDKVPVVGCVLGPMTLVTQLIGLEKAMYLAIDDTEAFSRLLQFATEVVIRFGVAQLQAGVHLPIVFDPSSTPLVIPPQFYREFVTPHLKQVFEAFKAAGSLINWLHTAGPINPILPYYPQMGVELANIDFCVNPQDAIEALPDVCIDGNIKPLSFVEDTAAQIRSESESLIQAFEKRGGFILSSGCEIPLEANPLNIRAMVQAAG